MIRGIGVSKGIGIGHALIIHEYNYKSENYTITDIESEKKRYDTAMDVFVKETQVMITRLENSLKKNKKMGEILKNQIKLLADEEIYNSIIDIITDEKTCCEMALSKVLDKYINMFAQMDNAVMNQRASDLEDIKHHMLNIFSNRQDYDLTQLPDNTIIVAKELHPSVTALMDVTHVSGIITQKGGQTSHTSILARALEIPAVLNVKNACNIINDNDEIIVDGSYGEIFLNPSSITKKIYNKKQLEYIKKAHELKKFIDKETVTKDGKKVAIYANITSSEDITKAIEDGAEGIGLYRTEVLFMQRENIPDEEEQFNEYKKAAILCGTRTLTIRTLDIGGDKDIPYLGLAKENNPYLGYRAVRFCLDRLDIFTTQLRAILRASIFGKIRVMIPLITSVTELEQVKQLITRIMENLDNKGIAYDKNLQVGVMMETPAASETADILAQSAAFFSIGTNDLTQYTLAVDRGNENVAYLYSIYHPAMIRSIKRIIDNAKNNNISVAMCGEAANDPALLPLMLSFGLDEFSVTSSGVCQVRKNIASWTMKEADEVTEKVLKMSSEKEIKEYLNNYVKA